MSDRFSSVEPLKQNHILAEFDCGSDAQTTWLRRHALQSHFGRMSVVWVVRRLADDRVVGFYALTSGSVLQRDAPERAKKGSGAYDIPAMVLTRLGVDLSEQHQGLGRALVKDCFERVASVAQNAGVKVLLIHSEDEAARDFYIGLAAFEASPTDPLHLTLLLKDLRRAMQP